MKHTGMHTMKSAVLLSLGVLALAAGCSGQADDPRHGAAGTVEEARRPGDVDVDMGAPDPMMASLQQAFQAENPGIANVTLLEFRRVAEGGGTNFVVARGVRPRGKPLGDELFGVFVFDDSLQTIQQTLGFFPTRRWLDYTVAITRATSESVWVAGQAISDSLDTMIVGYRWKP